MDNLSAKVADLTSKVTEMLYIRGSSAPSQRFTERDYQSSSHNREVEAWHLWDNWYATADGLARVSVHNIHFGLVPVTEHQARRVYAGLRALYDQS